MTEPQIIERLSAELVSLRDPELGYIRAGRPRYDRLFGRDSLIVAWQRLEREPQIAVATLRLLAAMQGREEDPMSEESPGKILHEWSAEPTPWVRWKLPYYGSVDATPLFVNVAAWTVSRLGDRFLKDELWPSVSAACGWIERTMDADGNGFLIYAPRNPDGLRHQGWKDGRDIGPKPPVALVEVQGYAYSALLQAASWADRHDAASAERWRARAAKLKDKFNRLFRIGDFFALAVQGDGSAYTAVTSNPGHLLFTGIVEPEAISGLINRLFQPDMFTRYGLRTLSESEDDFKADSYHKGSIWPHDNWIVSEGLRVLGYEKERSRVKEALLAAYLAFGKLPELYSVHMNQLEDIPYAQYPQAWATGALLNLLDSSSNPETALRILPPSVQR
jgi:glycogen debranching enzyme